MLPKLLRWAFSSYNRRILKSSQFSGELKITGLRESVTVIRYKRHVPHINADNNQDLFICQGYIHAQDRIWQMEINRRIGQGTVAEAFGKDALNTDRLTRTLGFNRLAEADLKLMNPKHRKFIEAYANGINAWQKKNKLPIDGLFWIYWHGAGS